ncbi:pyruvate kinase [[Mycoplasma] mobile]|uniref:Pyruvate kinase n=1 Tax=Mycoplasma mobile (strain ATCC 43663 / 163K / NCTC 11711) TaxID=267748 RepID=Q6KHW9_MYCM1|nr:pyruvate kinase [[Mycoplasma] mobile]AAT27807.1 pyruvate kinase [Mycoplasma mobile 163K]
MNVLEKEKGVNLTDKRSKMIATIGPSSQNKEILKQMMLKGMTTVRANFSHGDHAEQLNKFVLAKEVAKELNLPMSLMLDTKGPEIRVGKMKDGSQKIEVGKIITVLTDEVSYKTFEGIPTKFTVSHRMDKDVKVGSYILFDDGKLTTIVTGVKSGIVEVKTINSHVLKSNKRINIPGAQLSLEFLSKKDKEDIIFGIKNDVNYIAASFVNSKQDVLDLRKLLKDNNGEHIQIISKIESVFGIENIDEIIEASDGIMIARGDLGLEIPYFEVPFYEKQIIRKCRNVGKPVIVATQMLDSMEKLPQPTRAEVSDVYWATELGADATMLSGESANGDFPVESVEVMSTINRRAEKEFYNKLYYPAHLETLIQNPVGVHSKLASEVALKVMNGDYKFSVILSETGRLLKEIARFRPNTVIIGVINNDKLIHGFGITHSVFMSVDSKAVKSEIEKNLTKAREVLKPFFPKKGDKYLVVENNKISEYIY